MATPAAVLTIIVEANTGKAKSTLERFNRGLDDKVVNVVVKVDGASVAKAKAQTARLGDNKTVKLGVDTDMSSVARAKAVMSVLGKEGDKLGSVFDRSNLSIGHWVGILGAALPVIVDVSAAIGALAASAAAATAGLGALAIGGAGAATVGFGGIAGIAVPAIKSLKNLMTAQTAANKARSTGAAGAARAASSSAQQIQSANQAVTASEEQLKIAQESEVVAQKALTLARQDAVRQLQDMKRAAMESGTSEKRARLSIQQAEANLRQIRASGTASLLDIKDAELSVTEARQNAKDVSIQANRAQQDYNKAQKKGIDQMPGVVAAQQSLDSASRGVSDAKRAEAQATQNLAFQQKQANMATAAGGTSLAALALAQKKAGPAAVKFARNIKDLGHRWSDLTKTGRANFFGMLNDGLGRVNQKLPRFAKSADRSMKALRGGFDQFLKKATGPEFNHFIDVMTNTFAKSMKPLGDAFGNIAKVLQRIAVAVAPDLLRMFKGFDEMTKGWVDSTRNAGKLRDTIHGLVNQANTWWKLIKATAELIVAVLVPGMGQGKKAVEGITASIKGWTAWVESHPAAMRDFFKQGLETTKQLAQVLLGFLPMLFQVSKAMRPIARLFLGIVKGLNSIKVGNISALTVLLGAVVGARLITGISGIIGAFGKLKTAAFGAAAAEKAAVTAGGVSLGAGHSARTVTGGVIGSTGTTGGRFARTKAIARGIGSAAIGTAVISGIFDAFDDKGLQRSFGMKLQDFFHGATFGLVQGSAEAAQKASQAIADVISRIRPGGIIPEDAANIAVGAGKIKGLTDATLALVRVRSQLLPQLVREGSLTQQQADALAAYTKQQQKVLVNSKDFLTGRSKGLGFAAALAEDKKLIGPQVASILRQLGKLSPGARKEAANTMIGMAKVLEDKGKLPEGSAEKLRKIVGESWHGMRLQGVKESGKMAKGIAMNAGALVGAVTAGLEILKGNVQKSLKAFGVKALKFTLTKPGKAGSLLGSVVGALGAQRGGHIPGSGEGDKVRAMLEPKEYVVNKKAAAKHRALLDQINFRDAPRFQGGGVVDRTGVQHLAKGGMAAMVAEANRFEQKHFPYSWGGGHGSFGIQPVDCSGAVSDVLHAAGLLKAPMVSGDLAHWGKPGKGPLTVYANPVHTFMSLAGKFFGTSSSNPGGGAGWMGDPGAGYRAGFAARTMDVAGGAAARIARLILKGPDGPMKSMGQAALDRTRRAANKFVASKMPAGGFGGGQSLADFAKGPGKIVGASVYGFGEPGTGTVGAANVSLPGKLAFAELDMGTALGHLPFGKKLKISVGGRSAVGEKLDIGAGGGDVAGHHRSIDFWRDLAQKLGLSGSFLGLAKVQGLQKGGIVAPYVGSFAQGGEVAQTGLAHVHKGEQVLSLAEGGLVGQLGRVLQQGARHHIGPFTGHVSGLTHAEQIKHHIASLAKQIGKLDERIDIAQQLAGLSTSPGGSELSKGEIAKQVALERRLLNTLQKTLAEAKRGIRVTKRAMGRDPERLNKIRDKIKHEQRRKNPDKKQIAKWQGEIAGERAKHGALTGRLKGLKQTFNQTVVDMSGLTGKGGRIFDTTLALKELKATVPAGAAGLHIQDLLDFAEAMRYGAFKLPTAAAAGTLPTFAKGGVVPGPLGQAQAIIAHGGERVTPASASSAPTVEITFADGMGWLRQFMQVEIKGQERRTASRYRAGVRP